MQLTMGEVAAILGASIAALEQPEGADLIARGFSIDSRTIQPGQLFFALRGPRFDGHEFIRQALERGAVGAVAESSYGERAEPALAARLLPVRDTTQALENLGRAVRLRWGKKLIAVTGSTGKTTTKELIAALLSTRFTVHKSAGNLNNQYGLPLSLLGLEPRDEVGVMELAMSAAGEVARLARIAGPQIGVVTNVAPAHLEFFASVDAIALAKRELIENLQPPATAVLNFDDARVRRFAEGFKGRVVTFGFEAGADIRGTDFRPGPRGASAFRAAGQDFSLALPGRHNVENALAALAVASLFDIPPAQLGKALAAFQNLPQRSEILTLRDGITVINDSYNSNPLALERMLETLQAWPGAGRRILVAGEMLELGPESSELHRKAGRKAVECGVDWLLAVQGDARSLLEGAAAAGLARERGRFFPAAHEAGEYCGALLEPGDVVLVKGSRGVHLETVIGLLGERWKRPPETPPESGGAS